MAKKRSEYAREADRVRHLIKTYVHKAQFEKDAYTTIRDQIFSGSKEEFIERAKSFRSYTDIMEAFEEFVLDTGEEETPAKEEAFQTAVGMAEEALEHEYSPDIYHSPKTDAENVIDTWWGRVRANYTNPKKGLYGPLPEHVFHELERWKSYTIDLIGEDNFAELIEKRMDYKVDAQLGTVDWVDYFNTLYDQSEHRYETDGEVASRITMWLRKATDMALEYADGDDFTNTYDKHMSDLINELQNFYW